MKYDITQKRTRGAVRTLDAFYEAMLQLVSEQSFEDITVKELCEASNYPRATFYNYFEDKYDLLRYTLQRTSSDLSEIDHTLESYELVIQAFDKLYHMLDARKTRLEKILRHNPFDGIFIQQFREFMTQAIKTDLENCIKSRELPAELLAIHFSNTLMMMLEWIFLKQHELSIDEAHQQIHLLLQNVGK